MSECKSSVSDTAKNNKISAAVMAVHSCAGFLFDAILCRTHRIRHTHTKAVAIISHKMLRIDSISPNQFRFEADTPG